MDVDPRIVAGDVVALAAVVLAGELSHGVNPAVEPFRFLGTLVPFLVGWFVVASLVGAYGAAARDARSSVRVTAGAWIGGAGLGLVLRTSPYFHGGAMWPFGLVITVTPLITLLPWRVFAARRL